MKISLNFEIGEGDYNFNRFWLLVQIGYILSKSSIVLIAVLVTAKQQLDNVCFQMSNICIVFPNNSTSVILGEYLVSELNHVTFFVPEDGPHELAACTCYEEVKICSAGLSSKVQKTRNVFKRNMKVYFFLLTK